MTPNYSLKNKNKKKGFRQAMEKTIPQRIVFSQQGETAGRLDHPPPSARDLEESTNQWSEAAVAVLQQQTNDEAFTEQQQPRVELIPPSSRKDLPGNMIVTSVDVEADRWAQQSQEDLVVVDADVIDAAAGITAAVVSPETSSMSQIDWDGLDATWSQLALLGDDSFSNGMILAWQELGIDPATLTPKMMVNLGRVISCENREAVRILLMFGEAVPHIGFGGFAVYEDDAPKEEEELVVHQKDMLGWRVYC